jgi:acetyl-CoA acetyltransferase
MSDRTPTIVGAALSDYPVAPHLTCRGHHVQALTRALDDAGLELSDIDGFMSSSIDLEQPIALAEYLRIDHKILGAVGVGGAIFEWMVHQASAHLRAGHCETIVLTYGSDLLSRTGRALGTGGLFGPKAGEVVTSAEQFELPYGSNIVAAYALAATRHMHEFGSTPEQLAEIAVTCRHHAALNPHAQYRDPITVADVLKSRMIADPLHKLDCCVISDGGGAIIMTTAERARDLKSKPVFILGTAGTQTHHANMGEMPDFTRPGAASAGPRAMAEAGITPADIDTVQLYDSFTITVLLMLEGLGFCGRGEGGAFAASGALRLGGSLPLNTDGGGLSACHSGMRGMHLLVEAVRQLRGCGGAAQVPDAKIALVCGSGYYLSGQAVAIMSSEHP